MKLTIDELWREIVAAEKSRDEKLEPLQMMLDQFSGRGNMLMQFSSEYPENHVYEYMSLMVPKIVFDNPRATIRSRRQPARSVLDEFRAMMEEAVMAGLMDPRQAQAAYDEARKAQNFAKAVEHGANIWIRDSDYQAFLDRICYDYLLMFGASFSCLGTRPGDDPLDEKERRWPMSKRISMRRFLMDSLCLHHDEAIWMGHWTPENKDELLKRARREKDQGLEPDIGGKWDLEAIRALEGARSVVPKQTSQAQQLPDVDRDEVKVYSLWIRDHREDDWPGPDDGYNGAIFTVGVSGDVEGGDPKFIREPMPAWTPPWGPYALFGAYVESDELWPVSPLNAVVPQMNSLNAHTRAMNKNAAQYKRLVFVSDRNPRLPQDIKNKPDMFVIAVDDEQFDKNQIVEVEIAGVSEQQIKHYELFKDRLNRISGLTDAQRGDTNPDVTATADAIADSSAQLRISYIQKKFSQGVNRDLLTKVWMMVMDDRVTFPLGEDASQELGMLRPIFVGGPEEGMNFGDLELEVDVHSMGRVNEALTQRRVLEFTSLLTNMAPVMVEYPHMNWETIVGNLGDALNLPNAVASVDFDALKAMAPMMAQSQQQNGQRSDMTFDQFARREERPEIAGTRMFARESALVNSS